MQGQGKIDCFGGHLSRFGRVTLRRNLLGVKMRFRQKRNVDIADDADLASEKRGGRLLDVRPVGVPVHECRRDKSRAKHKDEQRGKCNQQAAQNRSLLASTDEKRMA